MFDGLMFTDHLLVVGVTLRGISGFDLLAHEEVDLFSLSFIGRQ